MESTVLLHSSIAPILDSVRVSGAILSMASLEAPFTVDSGDVPFGVFHAVLSGSAWATRVGGDPQQLEPGQAVVFPSGHRHIISDTPTPTADPVPVTAEGPGPIPTMEVRSGGPETRILCGTVAFEDSPVISIADGLPSMLVVGDHDSGIAAVIDLLADELQATTPGSDIVATRLVDVLAISAVRLALAGEIDAGWAAGLRDPEIGTAIAAIHERPAEPWTVTALASLAAMSRSAFYDRFTGTVGTPPGTYVARWRVHVACGLLRRSAAPVADIARAVGFTSPAAFSTAFKRLIGTSPLQYRHAA